MCGRGFYCGMKQNHNALKIVCCKIRRLVGDENVQRFIIWLKCLLLGLLHLSCSTFAFLFPTLRRFSCNFGRSFTSIIKLFHLISHQQIKVWVWMDRFVHARTIHSDWRLKNDWVESATNHRALLFAFFLITASWNARENALAKGKSEKTLVKNAGEIVEGKFLLNFLSDVNLDVSSKVSHNLSIWYSLIR